MGADTASIPQGIELKKRKLKILTISGM
jgi:hypothetical protein